MTERNAPHGTPASPASARNASTGPSSRKATRSASTRRGTSPRGRGTRSSEARADDRPRIIAVANQKGGVGKSTTAVSLGAALAELGHKVLVVDLDPQGNASTGLGIRHDSREVTVYDVLAAEAPIQEAIVATPVPNLWAVPSTIDLAGAEIELVSQFSRELRLKKALEPLKEGEFGFVFLDCPPSLGLLTVNALAAAEELIVPIQCEYYALEGLGQLLRNVRLVQQNVNPNLHLTGIVMTMFDPRTKLSEQVVNEVRKFFGDRVYRTIIPRTVRLSEAPGFGQPITVYDPRSRGAESYRDLAQEVESKLPDASPLPVIEEVPRVIVPPPEPARAPRPLARSEVEEKVEGKVEAEEPVEFHPRIREGELPLDTKGPREPEEPESPAESSSLAVQAASSLSESLADSTVEATGSEPRVDRGWLDQGEDEPEVETEAAVAATRRPQARVERADAGAEDGEVVEVGRVIVIDQPDAVAIDSSGPEPEDERQEHEAPSRRWRLFRRGRDR